jgi:hypothetical protein
MRNPGLPMSAKMGDCQLRNSEGQTRHMYLVFLAYSALMTQLRFEGKANFIAWRKIYPAAVEAKIRRIRGQGNVWVAEISIRYDGGVWNYGCSIHEFRGDKIARETIYFAEGWEAPEWRAPWRAAWQDESWTSVHPDRTIRPEISAAVFTNSTHKRLGH